LAEVGELIGSGRSADVYAHGDDEVLRRYRAPRDTEREAAAMEHARSHGYPVPAARALSDTDMVMDRVTGPTMLADLGRRPWRVPRHAVTLAELHKRLHAIAGPEWLPAPLGEGGSLLHLDLHPDNVILSTDGPMVIDWPNAAHGPAAADVANTWLVVATSLPPTGLYRRALSLAGRRAFLELFLRNVDRTAAATRLADAGAYRISNRSLPPGEPEAIRKLLGRRGSS
jgi:Ser/Thr protein kinase RdoA (MazF antagonist)